MSTFSSDMKIECQCRCAEGPYRSAFLRLKVGVPKIIISLLHRDYNNVRDLMMYHILIEVEALAEGKKVSHIKGVKLIGRGWIGFCMISWHMKIIVCLNLP